MIKKKPEKSRAKPDTRRKTPRVSKRTGGPGDELAGAPSGYDPEYHPNMAMNYALLGATDEVMAGYFEVAIRTFNYWKEKHPEFLQAILNGRERADADVAKGMYNRARGYTIKKQVAIKVKVDKDIEEVQVVTLEEEVPTEVNAAKFWLTNRNKKWRDKQEQEITFGNIEDVLNAGRYRVAKARGDAGDQETGK